MKDEIISFETAKILEKKNFDVAVRFFYINSKTLDCEYDGIKTVGKTSAPTQSLLQRWLREKHNINLFIGKQLSATWVWTIWGEKASGHLDVYYTYEGALEEGLQEALKLIK